MAAFTGLVTGVAVWAIWGGDLFPAEADPKGDPETWTREELRRWLAAVWRLAIAGSGPATDLETEKLATSNLGDERGAPRAGPRKHAH